MLWKTRVYKILGTWKGSKYFLITEIYYIMREVILRVF